MKFKKDKSGQLEKAVSWCIKKYRKDLECLSFLCVWRDKEKIQDGKLVAAEVCKLSNKNRDVFDYDVMLEVDLEHWKSISKEEKKKLIFHELQHVKVAYELSEEKNPKEEQEQKTAQEIFEELLDEPDIVGEPKRDKQDRVVFSIIPHNLEVSRFKQELLTFGLSPEEEALRQFLNYVKKNVGMTDQAD